MTLFGNVLSNVDLDDVLGYTNVALADVPTNDGTATIKNVVSGSGSFVITLTAAATAETAVNFWVIN